MSIIHVRPGEGRRYPMIDADHVAKAAFEAFDVLAPAGTPVSFEVVGYVPSDHPDEQSMESIISVTRRRGVRLAGA